MTCMNRRDFLKRSAGTAAAAFAASAAVAGTASMSASTARFIGQTGVEASFLGMGTGVRSWNGSSELTRKGRNAYMELLEHAYGNGIRYFDCADMYGSHDYIREATKSFMPREKLMLLTKTVSREPDLLKADLDRFRKEADTDYFDVVLLHCLTEPEWTENDALKGCMEVLAEAKAKGVVRAHGVSCHNLGAMEAAAKHEWVDVMLARINPFGIKMDGTVDEVVGVLKTAKANGKGLLGMKILGEGEAVDRMEESLNFAINLNLLDAMTIGFLAPNEVDEVAAKISAVDIAA